MFKPYITSGQLYGLLGLSGLYWAGAAIAIRYAGHILFQNRERQLAMYLTIGPIGYGLMRFAECALGLDTRHRLISTAILSGAAMLMDGVALMWYPATYENPDLSKKNPPAAVFFSRAGAAWILWGVGVSLGLALYTTTY